MPHNLPSQLTSFVGRTQEIAEIERLLASTRLLTLTGAGGCGKSRLALRVANDPTEDRPDGAWWVELAPLSNPAFVAHAVASALGVAEQPGRDLIATLVEYLRPKALLVLLDNCEHLLSACAQLIDTLLRECPSLHVLATSRERLGIVGELAYRVPSLSLPNIHTLLAPEDLVRYEAVRLFVERARFSQPAFGLTPSNASAVAQICHRLDGMPLAIELAAARVQVLAVEQIGARLDDRFQLLIGNSRASLPRHRTLLATMDWSYDLLSEPERVVLRRMSVFSGGCTLEAAEAVCVGRGIPAADILDLLGRLVDKSLLVAETHAGEARYWLLETVRQYAWDRLREVRETTEVHRRHRDWYLKLAERAEPELRGREQVNWLERLETEYDNLRAALEWSNKATHGSVAVLRLAGALQWFWHMRGYLSEGHRWLEAALAGGHKRSLRARAKALCGTGMMAWRLDQYEHANTLLQQSLRLFRRLRDQRAMGLVVHHLAHVAQSRGRFSQAVTQFEKSVSLFRRKGDRWGIGWSLSCLGGTWIRQGNYSQAASLLEESLTILGEVGDKWALAYSMSGLGMVASAQGDYERATTLLEKSLTIMRETRDKSGIATASLRLGQVMFRRGDATRAAALYKESLARRQELGDKEGIALCLARLAELALSTGVPYQAAHLFAAAAALRKVIGAPLAPVHRNDYNRAMASARAALGDDAFNAAWSAGQVMGAREAIEYAMAAIETLPRRAKGTGSPQVWKPANLLTAREQEVAVLVARGMTNRGIAFRLTISVKTADAHVQHILNKLAFHSRTQIATWAVAHGLHTVSPN